MKITFLNIKNISKEEYCEIFKTLQKNFIKEETISDFILKKKSYTTCLIIREDGEVVGYDRYQGSDWVINNDIHEYKQSIGCFISDIKRKKRISKINGILQNKK